MQPIDVEHDPRRPYVQIAASIRAAVLNGELKPGERLPSVAELAEFYGVAQGTVHSALRTLREERYIVSRPGAGTYVRDQAALPVPAGEEHALAGVVPFLFEMGRMKHIDRAGWTLLGIPAPETVAEHSFRAAIVGMTLAVLEGADPGHTAALALMHDAHETRIGDVPSVGRAYITSAAPEAISADQTAAMPDNLAKMFHDLTHEYESGVTIESRVAHDADKLETLLQAAEYGDQGYKAEPWKRTSIEALRTESAKQLARAINAAEPGAWWADFASSYHELRAAAQSRSRSTSD